MDSIGAFDAKTRLSELLERASRGETIEITRHGHPIARLVPVNGRDEAKVVEAIRRLRSLRGSVSGVTAEEMIGAVDEGHRI